MKNRGDSAIEFVLVLPWICLVLSALHWLFRLGIHEQKEMIGNLYEQRKILETKSEN